MPAWNSFPDRAAVDPPLGAGDCERLRDGMVAQPANTYSSATLALCGLWIARRNRHHRHGSLVGAVVAAAGLGSVAYHGPGGRAAGWAHDASIAAMLGVITLEDVCEVRPDLARAATRCYAATVAAIGALLAVWPHRIREVTALLAGAAAVTEFSARTLARGDTRRAHRTAEALMAVALVAYAAGRTEASTCRPDSWLQWHGLWHTLSGAAMVAWADAALRPQTRPTDLG
ncbi:hypothetical protein BH23ACT10_BH23ACT10_38350 [soil metagenome]